MYEYKQVINMSFTFSHINFDPLNYFWKFENKKLNKFTAYPITNAEEDESADEDAKSGLEVQPDVVYL